MKSFLLAGLASTASAHYVFPSLVLNGVTTPAWADVRQYPTYYTNNPVTDVTSTDIRCNVGGSTVTSNTSTVTAGQSIAFTVAPDIYHPGPAQVYLAKAPTGANIATWDGSGSVWFKIMGEGPSSFGSSGLTWPTDSATSVSFTIPKSVPTGDYLVRIEHIGLHVASSAGGAQLYVPPSLNPDSLSRSPPPPAKLTQLNSYISCAQLHVTNGGSGTPGPLVAFPGAYKATDPGLLINIYYPVPTNYTLPGPAVWKG
ncbi:hypothetical protein MMC10_004993 [Thelotrema lepadinum]|nr:hypothetical protein [Thelotrema lepadinum]